MALFDLRFKDYSSSSVQRPRRVGTKKSKVDEEATAAVQARDKRDSGQSNRKKGDSGTWSESGYIWKMEPTGFLMNWV